MAAKTKSTSRSKAGKSSTKSFKVNKTKLEKLAGAARSSPSPRQSGKLAAN